MDPNKRRHIFGEPRHRLDRLVRLYGSEAAAAEAIGSRIEAAFKNGELIFDSNGLFRQVFDIGGISVTVSGRVIEGIPRVGTAWVAP